MINSPQVFEVCWEGWSESGLVVDHLVLEPGASLGQRQKPLPRQEDAWGQDPVVRLVVTPELEDQEFCLSSKPSPPCCQQHSSLSCLLREISLLTFAVQWVQIYWSVCWEAPSWEFENYFLLQAVWEVDPLEVLAKTTLVCHWHFLFDPVVEEMDSERTRNRSLQVNMTC